MAAKKENSKLTVKVTYTEGYQQRIFDAFYDVVYKPYKNGTLQLPEEIVKNMPK